MILKADGPAVRILWSIDCNEACVTAAVRTVEKQTHSYFLCTDKLNCTITKISALHRSQYAHRNIYSLTQFASKGYSEIILHVSTGCNAHRVNDYEPRQKRPP